MKKLLLTAVLAVGALLTGASEGKAAFRIFVTHNVGPTQILMNNPGGANSSTTSITDFPESNSVFVPASGSPRSALEIESPNLISTQTPSPYGSILSSLTTNFDIANLAFAGGGVNIGTVTVTIYQDAYAFSGVQNNFSTNFTVSTDLSGVSLVPVDWNQTITQTAFAGSSTVNGGTVGFSAFGPTTGGSSNRGAFNSGGANPTSIVHQFTITNFLAGQTLSFSSNSTVGTPLPATAIGMLAGLPLLGLGGYIRRRFTA